MTANFECHITLDVADASMGEEVAKVLHWKTSEIARDPVLGQASYFYLTSHDSTYDRMFMRMKVAVKFLQDRGVKPVRQKIEHIVYDTKLGIVPNA